MCILEYIKDKIKIWKGRIHTAEGDVMWKNKNVKKVEKKWKKKYVKQIKIKSYENIRWEREPVQMTDWVLLNKLSIKLSLNAEEKERKEKEKNRKKQKKTKNLHTTIKHQVC